MESIRIDRYLAENGFTESREKACIALERGLVKVNGKIITKASCKVTAADRVELVAAPLRYVSRGGEKMEKAIGHFGLDFNGKTVLDIGSSTGGFTDCALQHGAGSVVAVDIGKEQLHPSLREHAKIILREGTDIRLLDRTMVPYDVFDVIVADVSFISLSAIMPQINQWMKKEGWGVLLVKPQFEQDRRVRTSQGIIRDEHTRQKALDKILAEIEENGLLVCGYVSTDADGKTRNVEYLIHIKKP